ncbi:hypothetical protein SY88_00550 [Clostridiales bacterium PH28_bin88]|nr:hypothetical protein SY88_00550 [Clostridiales bacterium PH28_bin88]
MTSFYTALQFLTRLPLPGVIGDVQVLGRSTAYFPLAGMLIGILLWLLYRVSSLFLPLTVVAVLLLIGEWLVTGGLHLDGLMDSIDGLFSGKPRERMLEIMKDSRVGALGAAGGMLLLLVKYSLLMELPVSRSFPVLVTVPVLARWSMVPAIALFPYARRQGLGEAFDQHTGRREIILATILAAGTAMSLLGPLGITAWLSSATFSLLVALRVNRLLGGLTGDIYGALAEANQVLVLLLAAAWEGW